MCQGAQSVGVPGFVSKTYLSFYAVLLCEVMAALPRVTEDVLTLLLPFLAAGLKGDASKEYTSATLMVLTQLLTRAQLSEDFLKGGCCLVCLRTVKLTNSADTFASLGYGCLIACSSSSSCGEGGEWVAFVVLVLRRAVC
jgi:hypothetical protein